MSFVRGHPRGAGWVLGHLRSPHRPDAGQLPLLGIVVVPVRRRRRARSRPQVRPA